MKYSVSIEDRQFLKESTSSKKTAKIIYYDDHGNYQHTDEFAYIDMERIEDLIKNKEEVNLDYCYIYGFSLENCRNNYSNYVFIRKFSARCTFFNGGVDFANAQFGDGNVIFSMAAFGNGSLLLLIQMMQPQARHLVILSRCCVVNSEYGIGAKNTIRDRPYTKKES